MISGGNDVIATTFHISLNAMTWGGRFAAIVAPPIAFYVDRRICFALQAKDRELVEHGIETGIVRQLPSGEFVEVTRPLPPVRIPEMTPVDSGHELPAETPTVAGMSFAGQVRPSARSSSPMRKNPIRRK